MEWRDEGVILSVRKHGENSAIINILTKDRGRHAGVVRGGTSRKMSAILIPGNQVQVEWRARLEDHLGSFKVEPLFSRAEILSDRTRLSALTSVCAIACFAFAERLELPELYLQTLDILDRLKADQDWKAAYVLWELAVLDDMGFGLDLSACVVTGGTQELIYVSPKSGCAVSASAGEEWADRLLPLPDFLRNGFDEAPIEEIIRGLRTIGYFLEKRLAPALGDRPFPVERTRLVERLIKERVKKDA